MADERDPITVKVTVTLDTTPHQEARIRAALTTLGARAGMTVVDDHKTETESCSGHSSPLGTKA